MGLAALGGAGPISSIGSAIANPTIAGTIQKFYSKPGGDTTVFSFVTSSEVVSFSATLLEFYTYLCLARRLLIQSLHSKRWGKYRIIHWDKWVAQSDFYFTIVLRLGVLYYDYPRYGTDMERTS